MNTTGLSQTIISSPLGEICILGAGECLTSIHFIDNPADNEYPESSATIEAGKQLQAYFTGGLEVFNLPLSFGSKTNFQREVWAGLQQIPFGTLMSYSEFAELSGKKEAVRAVGAAIGQNPFAIVVPCHRVIGKNGALTGYAWGLTRKSKLITLEWEKQNTK